MTTRILSMAAMAVSTLLISCGQHGGEEAGSETVLMSVEDMQTPTMLAVKIEGMTCPMGCAAAIQKECSQLTGVGKSEVNFDESTGYFTFDASILSEEDIIKCIEGTNDGGIYTATKVEESPGAEAEVEGDEATTEEALHVKENMDEAHV